MIMSRHLHTHSCFTLEENEVSQRAAISDVDQKLLNQIFGSQIQDAVCYSTASGDEGVSDLLSLCCQCLFMSHIRQRLGSDRRNVGPMCKTGLQLSAH